MSNEQTDGLTPGMPVLQTNAHLGDSLIVRAGIPHRGGKLALHACNEGYAAMVSANAFWNPVRQAFHFPEATDLTDLDFALDSAGFTAMQLWKARGNQAGIAGVYPWSYEQYVELASFCGASWYAQPDMCCEPEISTDREVIDYRIRATATMLEGTLRVVFAWQEQLSRDHDSRAVSNLVRVPVPVIQGYTVDEYRRSLDQLLAVWERWRPWLAEPTLIGLGSVCRRTLNDPRHGLYAVLAGLEGHLPAGAKLHLFGVKGKCLEKLRALDWIASVDSMGWDFGARVSARERGISNTIAHRSGAMSRWMEKAQTRATPAAGDQLRLLLAA
ncbi:MAG TPA: hypothetical protein VJU59_28840 [Paraburkholderia sp.]|uniref:deazapurine DNA modification protein DpdA family protein n=1 Tax=Paraburkholderia sp. TaxID=1926495 RepID=UPI002B463D35|nr:hypothetical protein [Paraburkholderia sp.]HKR43639.1 hypothetical protein [Paraburkholderia sp.]